MLEPLACARPRFPVFRRLENVVARSTEGSWIDPGLSTANPADTDETAVDRIDLKTLGPLIWSPFDAAPP